MNRRIILAPEAIETALNDQNYKDMVSALAQAELLSEELDLLLLQNPIARRMAIALHQQQALNAYRINKLLENVIFFRAPAVPAWTNPGHDHYFTTQSFDSFTFMCSPLLDETLPEILQRLNDLLLTMPAEQIDLDAPIDLGDAADIAFLDALDNLPPAPRAAVFQQQHNFAALFQAGPLQPQAPNLPRERRRSPG